MEITTKYNLGDEVFLLDKHVLKIKKGKIGEVEAMKNEKNCTIKYFVACNGQYGDVYNENDIFLSKEDLINSLKQQL